MNDQIKAGSVHIPLNKGKREGQKPPLKLKEIGAMKLLADQIKLQSSFFTDS